MYTETSPSNHRFNGNGLLDSPRSPSSHWTSVFRLPNSSSKKLNIHSTSLALDTHLDSAYEGIASNTHSTAPSLTPTSYISDQRSSYSSYTKSTDSNSAATSRSPFSSTSQNNSFCPPPHPHQSPINETLPSPSPSFRQTGKGQNKSEKQRLALSRDQAHLRNTKPQTTNSNHASYNVPKTPSRSKTNTPLSPKAVGASASRFIRRVASAPNAKGLFTLGSRSGSTTRNGMLAPIPPLPTPISSYMEKETDSLETLSSSSSKGRLGPPSAPVTPIKGTSSLGTPAFRRTYSSSAIKIRQVSVVGELSTSGP